METASKIFARFQNAFIIKEMITWGIADKEDNKSIGTCIVLQLINFEVRGLKYFYGVLTVFGIALPYMEFVPWIGENGFNLALLLNEAKQNRISSFAWLDVLISAVVLVGFILYEGKRKNIKHKWLPIVGTLTAGVSFGLPLFLLMREIHMDKIKKADKQK